MRRRAPSPYRPGWLLLALLVVVSTVAALELVAPLVPVPEAKRVRRVSLMIRAPEEAEEELEEPEEPEPEYTGQIVELSPPEEPEKPVESDYLAEFDERVEEETRTAKVEINPEVLSREYSDEQKAEQADVEDVNVEEDSTGATVGNDRFDPTTDGSLAAVPSPWAVTNQLGPEAPVKSSQTQAELMGAPQNDLLDEERGDVVSLNTTRYPWDGYMKRIRRQVNFWWQQNLDNLPSSVRLTQSSYTTEVEVILNADGVLEVIEVTEESGVGEIDDAVVRAFQVAGPFDNPPEGLIQKDGRVYLPDFEFTVRLGVARVQYKGIDPRAGVQFPGILKSPR